jgi:hypothetical protein
MIARELRGLLYEQPAACDESVRPAGEGGAGIGQVGEDEPHVGRVGREVGGVAGGQVRLSVLDGSR